ncbi:hypothetical protein [Xanthomonas sp. NCPPB 1128]|uniref:hypothetical protein n=1 Tax=Xanthomonas sp. NCPPB 1128 TaxID=1775876 RepID=UPI00103B5539|nr:hypothetical protein [Xanthomonas sp. NCPPB 1128]
MRSTRHKTIDKPERNAGIAKLHWRNLDEVRRQFNDDPESRHLLRSIALMGLWQAHKIQSNSSKKASVEIFPAFLSKVSYLKRPALSLSTSAENTALFILSELLCFRLDFSPVRQARCDI